MSSCNDVGKESSVASGSNLKEQFTLPFIKEEPLDDYESQPCQNKSVNNEVIPNKDVENIKESQSSQNNSVNKEVIPNINVENIKESQPSQNNSVNSEVTPNINVENKECLPSQNNSANNEVLPVINVDNIKKEPIFEQNCSSGVIPVYTISDDSNEADEPCFAQPPKQKEILTLEDSSGVNKKLSPIYSVAPPYTGKGSCNEQVQNALKNSNLRLLGSNHKVSRSPHVPQKKPLNPKEVNSISNENSDQNGNNFSKDVNYREHLPTSYSKTRNSYGQRSPIISLFASHKNFPNARSLHSVSSNRIQNQTQNRKLSHYVQSFNSHIRPSNGAAWQVEAARNFTTKFNQRVPNLSNLSRFPIGILKNCARKEQNEDLHSSTSPSQVKQASTSENLNLSSFSNVSPVSGNQLSTSYIAAVPPITLGSSTRRKIPKKKIKRIGPYSARNEESQSSNESRLSCYAFPRSEITSRSNSSHINYLQHKDAVSTSNQLKLPTTLENYNDHSDKGIGKSIPNVSGNSSEGVNLTVTSKRKNSSTKTSPRLNKSGSPSDLNGEHSPKKSPKTVKASKTFTNSPISSPTNLASGNLANSKLPHTDLTVCSTVESKEVSEKKTSKEVSEKKTSKEVSEKKKSKEVSEKKTSKEVSEKKKSKEVSEKKKSKEVSEKKKSKEVSEKKTSKEASEKKTCKESSRKSQKPTRIQTSVLDVQTHISNTSSPAQTCLPLTNNCSESTNQSSKSKPFPLTACNNATGKELESIAFKSQSESMNTVISADGGIGQMSKKTDSLNNFDNSYSEQFEAISSESEDSTSLGNPSVSPSLLNTTVEENFEVNLVQNMGNNLRREQKNVSDQRNYTSSLTSSYTKTSEVSNMDPFIPDDEPMPFFRHKIGNFETNISDTLNSQEILRQLMPGNDKSSFENDQNFPSNPSLNHQSSDLDSIPETNNLLCAESIAKFLLSTGQENCENEFSPSCPSTVSMIENDLSQLFDERNDAISVDSYQNCNSQIQINNNYTTQQTAPNCCDASQCQASFDVVAESHSGRPSVTHTEVFQNSGELASDSKRRNNDKNGLSDVDCANEFSNSNIKLLPLPETCNFLYTQDESKYYSFNPGIPFICNNEILAHVVKDCSHSSLNSVSDALQQDSFPFDEQFYDRCKNCKISSSEGFFKFKLIILEMRGYSSSGFQCRPLNKGETVYECENFWLSLEILQRSDVKLLFELMKYSKSQNFETSPSVHETSARPSSVPETSERTHKLNSVLYYWPAKAYSSNTEMSETSNNCTSILPAEPENVENITEARSMIFIVLTNLTVINLARVISLDQKFADLFVIKPTLPEDKVVSFINDPSCNTSHNAMQISDNPEFANETATPQNSLLPFRSWQNETNLASNARLLNYSEHESDEVVIIQEFPNGNLSREETFMEKFSNLENPKTDCSINSYSVTRDNQNSGDSSLLVDSPHVGTQCSFDGSMNSDNGVNYSTSQRQYHSQCQNNDDDTNRIGENAFFDQLSVIPEIRQESLEPINNQCTINKLISNKQVTSQPTFNHDHHQQIPGYRNCNSENASIQDISHSVNNPHFLLHSSHTGAKCSTNEPTNIGNSNWNQNSYSDELLESLHCQELGIANASFLHQPIELTPEARQTPFSMVRQLPNPQLISSHQTDVYSGDSSNQHQIIGQLERCVDRFHQNSEPRWNISSRSNVRCEPVRAHSNYRGGVHRRSTNRHSSGRSFLQTSGGNIIREEMDRPYVYGNVNKDVIGCFPGQDKAINYSLIGEGTRHIASCPTTHFSQPFNQVYSGRPSQGIVNTPHISQFHTLIGSPHPNLPMSNEPLYGLQREEVSPQSNSENQSLSPNSVVYDLSMNESYNIPEANNLYAKSPSLPKVQNSTNFSPPDSGNCSNSETEIPHEAVLRFQRHSDACVSTNMQPMNLVGVDDQTMLLSEIDHAISGKDENKLSTLLITASNLNNNLQYFRIKAHICLNHGKYEEVIHILKNFPEMFPFELHKELQKVWGQAWESLESGKFIEHPKPKTKDKHPFPVSIYCDVQRVLNDAYEIDQYPKIQNRQQIADVVGYSEKQVGNWFKNRRQREKRKAAATHEPGPRRGGGGRRGRKRNAPPAPEYMTSFSTNSHNLPVFPGNPNIDPFNVASSSQDPDSHEGAV